MLTPTEIFVLAIAAIGMIAGIIYGVKKYRHQQMLEAIADETFERAALQQLQTQQVDNVFKSDPPSAQPEPVADPANYQQTYPEYPQRSQAAPTSETAGSADIDSVVLRLQGAGLYESSDGYLELNGNPRAGAVIKVKGNKRVLVLSYLETEHFLARETRRYDYILIALRGGKVIFLRDFNEWMADQLSGAMFR